MTKFRENPNGESIVLITPYDIEPFEGLSFEDFYLSYIPRVKKDCYFEDEVRFTFWEVVRLIEDSHYIEACDKLKGILTKDITVKLGDFVTPYYKGIVCRGEYDE